MYFSMQQEDPMRGNPAIFSLNILFWGDGKSLVHFNLTPALSTH